MCRPESDQNRISCRTSLQPIPVVAQDLRVTRRGSFYFTCFRFYFYAFTNPSRAGIQGET